MQNTERHFARHLICLRLTRTSSDPELHWQQTVVMADKKRTNMRLRGPQRRRPAPRTVARQAHLHYATDQRPGVRRGRAVRYLDPAGRTIRNRQVLDRIAALAIPPAWTDVWICPSPAGHLQATGRDQRGRKQYRYHPRWNESRDALKYERLIEFAKALPRLRRRLTRDLARPGVPREKILAALVRLLAKTLIRVGNEQYTRENGSFGLTTLRDRHVRVRGETIHFHFRGKSGIVRDIDLADARLARIIRRCQDLPGQELFEYLDEEHRVHAITSEGVNAYLKDIAGQDFTAKDFRTWAATTTVVEALRNCPPANSAAMANRQVARAIAATAQCLGNTTAVCRKSYIPADVLEAHTTGRLARLCQRLPAHPSHKSRRLAGRESLVLALLRRLSRRSAGDSIADNNGQRR